MKKLILFSLFAILLMSCGGAGKAPTDYITFGTAFGHVAKSFSYWLFILLASVPLISYIYAAASGKIDRFNLLLLFLFVTLFAFSIFFRPCEIAANTTVEQAARGAWIGY